MLKKNKIVTIFFVLCISIILWKSKSRTAFGSESLVPLKKTMGSAYTSSATNILKRDFAKLEENFNEETLQDENWLKINDYTLDVKNLVTLKNAKHLFRISNENVASLVSCLKKDFCGMERRNGNDAYFDESNTPGHILLGRSLHIIIEALQLRPELQSEIDWDLIRELTDNSNETIQVLAIEILNNFNSKNRDLENLFKVVDNYMGNAKADALAELAIKSSANEHILMVNSLGKSFSIDDPNTVISIVDKIETMNLSNDELIKVSKSLCHFKENGLNDPNWKMIKHCMGKVSLDLKSICNE